MKRIVTIAILAALSGCATVEDHDCRRTAQILNDASHYNVCLIQKGKA